MGIGVGGHLGRLLAPLAAGRLFDRLVPGAAAGRAPETPRGDRSASASGPGPVQSSCSGPCSRLTCGPRSRSLVESGPAAAPRLITPSPLRAHQLAASDYDRLQMSYGRLAHTGVCDQLTRQQRNE